MPGKSNDAGGVLPFAVAEALSGAAALAMPGQVEQDDGIAGAEQKLRPLNQGQPVGAPPMQQHNRAATALSIGYPADKLGRIGLIEHDPLDGKVARRRQSLPGLAGDQHSADVPVEHAPGNAEPDQHDREPQAKLHCRFIRTDIG